MGRNNLQNDKLTLHTARGKDLWFHVQKAPGSHCVVMSRGEDIPDTTKQEAAELAVLAFEPERRCKGRRGHHRGQKYMEGQRGETGHGAVRGLHDGLRDAA